MFCESASLFIGFGVIAVTSVDDAIAYLITSYHLGSPPFFFYDRTVIPFS